MKTPIRVSYVRKHEVKLLLGLEAELQGHDERVVHEREHGALREDVRDLARPLRDIRFTDGLEGVYPLRVLLPDLHDLSEAALANDLEQVELLYCERLMPRGLEVDFEVERAVPGRSRVPLVRGPLHEIRMSADT